MRLSVLAISFAALAGCGPKPLPSPPERPAIIATTYPLAYFLREIKADYHEVIYPVPVGVASADWQPDAEAAAKLRRAWLVVLDSRNAPKWADPANWPKERVLDISVKDPEAPPPGRGEAIGYTWLDLDYCGKQWEAVARQMPGLDPDSGAFARLDLARLHLSLVQTTAKLRGVPLVASQPVYGHFVRAYGLNIRSVHWDAGRPPNDGQIAELKALLADHPAKLMIWHREPAPATRVAVESLGLKCVVFDPCEQRPEGNFMTEMKANIERLGHAREAVNNP